MQRSEGGGLGVGGSSSGFMTARGAADFLTRSTAILGGLFIVLSIVMAAIAGATREPVEDRYVARQQDRAGRAASRSRRSRPSSPATRRSRTSRRRRSRSPNKRSPDKLFSRPRVAPGALNAPKPQLPWRGSFLSPAAWSHRLAKVFCPPPSGRSSRRAATRSASASSTPISTSIRGRCRPISMAKSM